MLRALWVVMLFTIASSAFADDENDQRFRNAVNAVSELGYTGAAAVVCELRSEDWGEDLIQNRTKGPIFFEHFSNFGGALKMRDT
jgi:hypothetical protein